jgi:methylated-DNA-[protein]-cysteine S-methyltransferase
MRIETPFGAAWAAVDAQGAITAFGFGEPRSAGDCESPALIGQLREYFAGAREVFDLPLAPSGTPFQQTVWKALREIPYGETVSYAELAARLGRPKAARAVGRANATNPIALLVPCHRVVGSDGSLTGFAYGTDLKKKLLEFEATSKKSRRTRS